MAIFYLSTSSVSRATGRSSVAASAYITGTLQTNERDGRTHDYRAKSKNVLYTTLAAPQGAPQWMTDRKKLWNEVERVEKRKDARTARMFVVAFPHEFSQKQNIALMRDFAQTLTEDGMVVDMAMHPPHKTDRREPKAEEGEEDTNKNVHGHFLCTTRRITSKGFGPKVRDWNSKEYLQELKKRWEKICNRHLAQEGYAERIDSRSPLERELPLLPEIHLGVKCWHMERRGIRTRKGNYNRAVKRFNRALTTCYERLAAIPDARDKAQRELDDISARDKRIEQLTAQCDALSKRLKSLDHRRTVLLDALHTGRLAHKPTGVINKLSGRTNRWTRHWRRANKYIRQINDAQGYLGAKAADVGQALQRSKREQYLANEPRKDHDALARLALGDNEQQDKSLIANRQLMSEAAKEREANKQIWRSI